MDARRRCERCPRRWLDVQLLTEIGTLATRCMEIAVAQESGVTFSLHDLTAEEYTGLPVARQELERWRQEQRDREE